MEKYEVPKYYYSLGESTDDCVCLEYKNGKWIVYDGSRGQQLNARFFNTPSKAASELFESVAIGDAKLEKMRDSLHEEIDKYARKRRRRIQLKNEREKTIISSGTSVSLVRLKRSAKARKPWKTGEDIFTRISQPTKGKKGDRQRGFAAASKPEEAGSSQVSRGRGIEWKISSPGSGYSDVKLLMLEQKVLLSK